MCVFYCGGSGLENEQKSLEEMASVMLKKKKNEQKQKKPSANVGTEN